MNELTYSEWSLLFGNKLQDNEFDTEVEIASLFKQYHEADIYDEIEKINQNEYQLYLQRHKAGVIEQ